MATKRSPHPLQVKRCRALLEFEELAKRKVATAAGSIGKRNPQQVAAQAVNPSTSNDKREREQRQLELSWLMTKTLVEINGKLTDIATLIQQQTDLLRRLVEKTALP